MMKCDNASSPTLQSRRQYISAPNMHDIMIGTAIYCAASIVFMCYE